MCLTDSVPSAIRSCGRFGDNTTNESAYSLWTTCTRAHVYRCHIVTSVKVKIAAHKFSISPKFIHYKSSFAAVESPRRLLFFLLFGFESVGKCKLNVCAAAQLVPNGNTTIKYGQHFLHTVPLTAARGIKDFRWN